MTQALLDLGPRVGAAPSGSRGASRHPDGPATSFDETLDATVEQADGRATGPATGWASQRDEAAEPRHAGNGGEPDGAATDTSDAVAVDEPRVRDNDAGRGRHGRDRREAAADLDALALAWYAAPRNAPNEAHGVDAARADRGGNPAGHPERAVGPVAAAHAGKHRTSGHHAAQIPSVATHLARTAEAEEGHADTRAARGIGVAMTVDRAASTDTPAHPRHSAAEIRAHAAMGRGPRGDAATAAGSDAAATARAAHADGAATATTATKVPAGPAAHASAALPQPALGAPRPAAAAPQATADQHRTRQSPSAATDATVKATSPTAVHLPGTATLTHPSVAAPAPPPPVPMAQPELAGTLARLRSAADGTYQLRVSVHPAELGGVNVTATVQHGVLSVVLSPDPTAHHAISQALPQLRAHLADQGFVGVDVGLGSPQQGGGQPGEQGPHAQGSGRSTTPNAIAAVDSAGDGADGAMLSVRHRSDHTTLDRLL